MIPLVHIAQINKIATLHLQLFTPLEETEVLVYRNVGHSFGLYVGANSRNIDMEFLLTYALDTRIDFYWTMDVVWVFDRNFGLHYQLLGNEEFLFVPLKAFTLRQRVQSLLEQITWFPSPTSVRFNNTHKMWWHFLRFAIWSEYTRYHHVLSQLLRDYCFPLIWRYIPVVLCLSLSLESCEMTQTSRIWVFFFSIFEVAMGLFVVVVVEVVSNLLEHYQD